MKKTFAGCTIAITMFLAGCGKNIEPQSIEDFQDQCMTYYLVEVSSPQGELLHSHYTPVFFSHDGYWEFHDLETGVWHRYSTAYLLHGSAIDPCSEE